MPTAEEEVARVQLTGVLCKRPVTLINQSGGLVGNRWYKRFFVIKDGFLMYYAESEKREFEKKKCANYRPNGLMPLGDCLIQRMQEPDTPHMISIVNELSQDRLVLQCESQWEQDKWMDGLEKAARICFKNAQLGDTLIQQLQVQGARLAEEKQSVSMQLYDEAQALSEERTRNEEMEQLMQAMESEKKRLEETSDSLHRELETVSRELQATASAMKEVEAEKNHLVNQQTQLSTLMSTLEEEKLDTEQKLLETQTKSVKLEELNQELSSQSAQSRAELAEQIKAEQKVKLVLEDNLKHIAGRMEQVLSDKETAEQKVEEQVQLAKLLQDEKLLFHQEAAELERNLNEVKQQKEMTEVELKEEIKARIKAEEQLREANLALESLESRINEVETVASEEHRNQLMKNVKALKRYFEEKAIEAQVEANKPVIMKRAVDNKRRKLRAKSMRLIRADKDSVQLRVREGGDSTDSLNSDTVRIRNSASNVLRNPELRTMIAQSVHGDVTF